MTIVLIILVVLALPYLIRKQSKVILVGCHVRCRKKCCFMCNIGVSRSKCFFALKSNSFILTCGKKQNTVKTEEKHEQRNESQFGADNVCPRYADYGVSVLPAVMYGETDYAATSENKSNRRVVKCLRFSILLDKTGDSAYSAVTFDCSTVAAECGRQRRNQQKTREALSVTEDFPCLFLKK